MTPIQSGDVPLTVPAETVGSTVSVLNELTGLVHPLLTVYVILVVPAETAVTTPDDGFTVATPELLLLHVPPGFPLLV